MSTQTVICGDSKEVLKTLDAESVDLVLTSPPYDNLRDYEGFTFDFEGIARELYRVLKKGGVIVWVVGDSVIDGSESGTSFKQALFFKALGLNIHDTMIYEKSGICYPDTNRYYQIFEYMFVFSKGKPNTTNMLKDRKNGCAGAAISGRERKIDGKTKPRSGIGKRVVKDMGVRFNIWRYVQQESIRSEHPAVFPEKLAADHIISWSNEGDLVLDPFNGSGTTTKCAKYLKRNFIGIDISERYCEIARRRLSQEMLF